MTQEAKRRALGRGLGALLGNKPSADLLTQARPVPISLIRPNRYQPRNSFNKEQLRSLTDSIRHDGVLVPVLLRPFGDAYELIAGERRWRAAQAASLLEIPAIIREVDDQQALEFAIIENEQRDDLSAIESARAYQRLVQEFGLTQQTVAERIGISRSQVANIIRLLLLPEVVQKLIEQGKLEMGHARPLIGLPHQKAVRMANKCIANAWSARQMERAVKLKAQTGRISTKIDADVAALQNALSRNLGLQVEFRCKSKGSGELCIRYSRLEELDAVLAKLRT